MKYPISYERILKTLEENKSLVKSNPHHRLMELNNSAKNLSYDDLCDEYSKKLLSCLCTKDMGFSKIEKALKCAKEYHKGQLRASGEPYFIHPIEVSILVARYLNKTDMIVASILHDILEDTNFSRSMMGLLFGAKVVNAVCILSNISHKIKLCEENSLAMLYKADNDILTIKLCDRLHNMRTIEYMLPCKQKKKALQTLRTFIPLAKYLGTQEIEDELIQICNNVLSIY